MLLINGGNSIYKLQFGNDFFKSNMDALTVLTIGDTDERENGGYFSFVVLPKLAGSFKLTAKGSKAHSKSMGCQIPDSEHEAVTWLTFSAPERITFRVLNTVRKKLI